MVGISRYMRCENTIVALLAIGFLLGCTTDGKRKPDKRFEIPRAGYPVSVEPSGSEEVDALVRQLVSQRPAPYRSGYGEDPAMAAVTFANGYRTPKVEAAIERLKKMGPAVFPALVKHLGDDRYSYSDVVAAWQNYSVGDAVARVLCDDHYMHSGYKSRHTPTGAASYLSFDDYLQARDAGAWADWAKTKTRLEIQMDFIDWCILQETKRGFLDETQRKQTLENYEDARQRVRKEYSAPARATPGSRPIRPETNRTSPASGSRYRPLR